MSDDLVDDPLGGDQSDPSIQSGTPSEQSDAIDPDNPYAHMSEAELAEVARLAQERTREQWAKEDAEHSAEVVPEVESVAELQARLARQQEAEEERIRREQALDVERRKWEAERREEQRKARIEAWDEKMRAMYPRFLKARLPMLEPPAAAECRGWLQDEEPGTLLLLGGTGSGKTFAAFAVMRETYVAGKRTRFWPVPNLLDVMRPGKEGDKHFTDAREVGVLALDDIGVEKASTWVSERLYIIINDRWLTQRRTIVTTNLDLAGMKETLGDRMYSRIRDGAHIVQMDGKDRRLKK